MVACVFVCPFFFLSLYFSSCFRKEKPVIKVHFLHSQDKTLDFVLLSPDARSLA